MPHLYQTNHGGPSFEVFTIGFKISPVKKYQRGELSIDLLLDGRNQVQLSMQLKIVSKFRNKYFGVLVAQTIQSVSHDQMHSIENWQLIAQSCSRDVKVLPPLDPFEHNLADLSSAHRELTFASKLIKRFDQILVASIVLQLSVAVNQQIKNGNPAMLKFGFLS